MNNFAIKHLQFNDTQIKLYGMLFMSIDHLGLYVLGNNTLNNNILRVLGRIAAPLYLFAVVQGMHHSSNRKYYILRLYIYHICICVIEKSLSYLFLYEIEFNVIPVWLFTAIYIYLIDNIIRKEHIVKNLIIMFMPIMVGIGKIVFGFENNFLMNILLPNVFLIRYSPFFLILGISWYYTKNRKKQIIILTAFSVFVLLGTYIVNISQKWIYTGLFNYTQVWMILAMPFIALYDGNRGKEIKLLFYIYYPMHVVILLLVRKVIY